MRKTIFAFLVCVVAASAAKRHLITSSEGAAGLILQQISQEAEGPRRLARDLDQTLLESMIEEVTLEGAIAKAEQLMAGQVRGRIVVKIA